MITKLIKTISLSLLFLVVLSANLGANGFQKIGFVYAQGLWNEPDPALFFTKGKYDLKDSQIQTIGIYFPLEANLRFFKFDTEIDLVKHSGRMNHYELNPFLIMKFGNWASFPFLISIGEGLSIASSVPTVESVPKGGYFLENRLNLREVYYLFNQGVVLPYHKIQLRDRTSNSILNYSMLELAYKPPLDAIELFVFFRLHYRSGIGGLYCPPEPLCGSSYLSLGLRMKM